MPAASVYRAILLSASLLFPLSCRQGGEEAPAGGIEALESCLREIEALRSEKRDLKTENRELARALESLKKKIEEEKAMAVEDAKRADSRIDELSRRIRSLEDREQASSQPGAQEAADPGPDGLARLFLQAVRMRDDRAVDSMVDWEGVVEEALRSEAGSPESGAEAVDAFRELDREERNEKIAGARNAFISSVLGDSGPSPSAPSMSAGGDRPLEYRFTDSDGKRWSVLLARRAGTWRVVGMASAENRSASETPGD